MKTKFKHGIIYCPSFNYINVIGPIAKLNILDSFLLLNFTYDNRTVIKSIRNMEWIVSKLKSQKLFIELISGKLYPLTIDVENGETNKFGDITPKSGKNGSTFWNLKENKFYICINNKFVAKNAVCLAKLSGNTITFNEIGAQSGVFGTVNSWQHILDETNTPVHINNKILNTSDSISTQNDLIDHITFNSCTTFLFSIIENKAKIPKYTFVHTIANQIKIANGNNSANGFILDSGKNLLIMRAGSISNISIPSLESGPVYYTEYGQPCNTISTFFYHKCGEYIKTEKKLYISFNITEKII